MKLNVERYRILLSRICAGIALFFIFSCKSHWETKDEMLSVILFTMGIVLVGIASLGRMWCSLYIAGYKDEKLITTGPYSICRNPLYFFSMLGVLGIGFCTETISFPAVFILIFLIYYPFVIKSEESRLKMIFGNQFDIYAQKTPGLLPSLSNFEEPDTYVVNPHVYRAHIFSALWFVWIVGILEVIEGMKEIGLVGYLWSIY